MLIAPILNTFLSPDDYTQKPILINMDIPEINEMENVKLAEVRLISYNDNKRFTLKNNGGIENNNFALIFHSEDYSAQVEIPQQNNLSFDTLYKLQLRLIKELPEQIEEYSEWSNIIILKCFHPPVLEIENAIISQNFPVFKGRVISHNSNNENDKTEFIEEYKYTLYQSDILIEDSGWLLSQSQNKQDSYRFNHLFQNDEVYKIKYWIKTNNGYYSFTEENYDVVIFDEEELSNLKIEVQDNNIFCQENGCMQIFLTTLNNTLANGVYFLLRSSEFDNYTRWEELQSFSFDALPMEKTNIYNDFSIESGVKYKYAIQKELPDLGRSTLKYELEQNVRKVDFNYSYLLGDGVQLKLKYNNDINNMKRNVHMNKIETINSKYPTLIKNGIINYLEFPISGLISLSMDEQHTFFRMRDGNLYYKNELLISNKDYETFNSDLVPSNIKMEKLFRDKVVHFLSNGNNKLFKSATEGNILLNLMNISLTPNKALGRMIYSFSATAYEIADCTLENLFSMGIIDKRGNIEENYEKGPANDNEKKVFGQSALSVNEEKDLLSQIQEQVNNMKTSWASYTLIKIDSIKVSLQPKEITIAEPMVTLAIQQNGELNNIVLKPDMEYCLALEPNGISNLSILSDSPVLVDYIYTIKPILRSGNSTIDTFNINTITGRISLNLENEPNIRNINLIPLIYNKIAKSQDQDYKQQGEGSSKVFVLEGKNKKLIISSLFDIQFTSNMTGYVTFCLKYASSDKISRILIGPTQSYMLQIKDTIIDNIFFEEEQKNISITFNYKAVEINEGSIQT